MSQARWMIYGAYGYTGALIARHAVERGHRPLLAGRRPDKLATLAQQLGLESVAVELGDRAGLMRALEGVELVLHTAGPFVHTSAAMIEACLTAGAHYVDITGELAVFRDTLGRDAQARARGVLLLSGAGFDVVPTDCLARWVAERLPGATRLELALAADFKPSSGTAKSALDVLLQGSCERREGALVTVPLASKMRRVRFADRERCSVLLPLGDLISAYHTTGIPEITTYVGLPAWQAWLTRHAAPIGLPLLRLPGMRAASMKALGWVRGGDESVRARGGAQCWARAERGSDVSEAWLELSEPYSVTQTLAVRAVERVLAERPVGASTPARVFGADFVLEVPGVRRHTGALPER